MKRMTAWLISLFVLSILTAPVTVRESSAQEAGRVYRVGLVAHGTPLPKDAPPPDYSKSKGPMHAFLQRLAELGYVQGKNLDLELRPGEFDQLKGFALQLARDKVDVIFTIGVRVGHIVQNAVKTTPIVFFSCDPFEHVKQLAHPGSNVTGSTCMSSELSPKRLELLKELVPKVSRVAYFSDPKENPTEWKRSREAAPGLGITLKPFGYEDRKQLPDALKTVANWQPAALFVAPDGVLYGERRQLADFALARHLPSMYPFPRFAEAGALMAYGPSVNEMFTVAAEQVATVLGGARPGDVPVRRAAIFHLVINLKTARAIGVTVPQSLLLQADEVIE
jgi:putative ABC transport system substrate-binding protein